MNQPLRITLLVLIALTPVCALAQQGKTQAEAKSQKYRQPLPENVERRNVTIWSDGTRMAGDLYLPKEIKPDAKLPAIVFIHGTGGTKKAGFSVRLGHAFAQQGYIFLNFDYRGWGESESKLQLLEAMPTPNEKGEVTVKARAIRWQMDFADQSLDIRNAIAFMTGEKNVDLGRIGIFGTSYGGGLTVWAAAHDPRVKCAAVQVPGMGGGRGQAFQRRAYGLLRRQTRGETESVPFESGAPGGKMSSYAHMRYNTAKGIGYDVFEASEKIKIPMLIIDAGKEELMDTTKNGGRVAEILKKNGTSVKYHVMKDIDHYGIYGKKFQEALDMELEFFGQHLKTGGSLR
jgi:hypothetical protein